MEQEPESILLIIISCIAIWLFVKQRRESKQIEKLTKENSKLLADTALLEAEHLKFQLQPHTLNNILANLRAIANKLNKGMDSLSETLDYILYQGKPHLVSIEDEIEFIRKYLDLNDLFISEIDSIKMDDTQVNKHSKHFKKACVPHLISVYFIENAFKHGDVNHPEFLKIQLILNDNTFEVIVINRIKTKATNRKGGIGLSNMRKRLDLLHTGTYEIKTSTNEQEYLSILKVHF